ncbi:MAG: glycosyltransferase family 2 protein [Flavobacteriales bacterium]
MNRIAIVTICRNAREDLERTFASIDAQTDRRFAHVVIDGASADGSAELIRARGERLACWVSEPDRGIYDAMNKGWRMAESDFVLFLNAGDALAAPDALARALPQLDEGIDIAYGDLILREPDGGLRHKRYPDRITSAWLMRESPPHPAQFIRRALLERWGGYDERWRIAADYAFFARAFWQGGLCLRKLPFAVSIFDTRGLSSRPGQMAHVAAERKAIQRLYAPFPWYAAYHAWAAFNRLIGR